MNRIKKVTYLFIFFLSILFIFYFFSLNPIGTNEYDFGKFKKWKTIYYVDSYKNKMCRFKGKGYDSFKGELILLGKTNEVGKRYVIPRGVKEEINPKDENQNKVTLRKTYVREIDYYDGKKFNSIEKTIQINSDLNQKVLLQEWEYGPVFYVPLKNIEYYEEVAVKFIKNDLESYKKYDTGTCYLPAYFYELIQKGLDVSGLKLKDIPLKRIYTTSNKLIAQKDTSQVHDVIHQVKAIYEGRNIYQVINNKSFFYKSPSDRYKRKEYIIKADFVCINKIEYGFGYARFYDENDNETGGWLDMNTLKFQVY